MSSNILLIKIKDINKINNPVNYHLRKLGNGGYVLRNCVFLVNKENKIVGIVQDNWVEFHNGFFIENMYSKEEFELTPKQYDKLISHDKLLLLISLLNTLKLDEPVDLLDKPVRGIRLGTVEESKKLWLWYVSSLFNFEEVSSHEILYGSERLNKIYAYCMELDIIEHYFTYLEKRGGLFDEVYSKNRFKILDK